jgi:hypothetical protein
LKAVGSGKRLALEKHLALEKLLALESSWLKKSKQSRGELEKVT